MKGDRILKKLKPHKMLLTFFVAIPPDMVTQPGFLIILGGNIYRIIKHWCIVTTVIPVIVIDLCKRKANCKERIGQF